MGPTVDRSANSSRNRSAFGDQRIVHRVGVQRAGEHLSVATWPSEYTVAVVVGRVVGVRDMRPPGSDHLPAPAHVRGTRPTAPKVAFNPWLKEQFEASGPPRRPQRGLSPVGRVRIQNPRVHRAGASPVINRASWDHHSIRCRQGSLRGPGDRSTTPPVFRR